MNEALYMLMYTNLTIKGSLGYIKRPKNSVSDYQLWLLQNDGSVSEHEPKIS